uniref:Uncharacterized protein n=1 Tax=Cacopsylla melanoneura TaxID=428564 RepID=A0A8D8MBJ8_9HEMI
MYLTYLPNLQLQPSALLLQPQQTLQLQLHLVILQLRPQTLQLPRNQLPVLHLQLQLILQLQLHLVTLQSLQLPRNLQPLPLQLRVVLQKTFNNRRMLRLIHEPESTVFSVTS